MESLTKFANLPSVQVFIETHFLFVQDYHMIFGYSAPRHPSAQDPDPVLRQQDGHEGLHVLRQGLPDPRPRAHHGQGIEKDVPEVA